MLHKNEVVCHITHIVSEIRSCNNADGYINKDTYDAIVNVLWLADDKVMLRGANGALNRKTIVSCFRSLFKLGVKGIILTRSSKKKMPFGKIVKMGLHENTWAINLVTLRERNII